jgi:hypothetical protein
VTETLNEQVGHAMVNITCVNDKSDTKSSTKSEHNLLVCADFGSPSNTISRTGQGQFTSFIVCAESNTFNVKAFRRIVIVSISIEQVVLQFRNTRGTATVNLVTQGTVGIKVRGHRLVIDTAFDASCIVILFEYAFTKSETKVFERNVVTSVLDAKLVVEDCHFDGTFISVTAGTNKL